MSDMQEYVFVSMADEGLWVSLSQFDGFEKYILNDIHKSRVTELLESNNALLERVRRAEEELECIKNTYFGSGME
jgi:hypothetical protein